MRLQASAKNLLLCVGILLSQRLYAMPGNGLIYIPLSVPKHTANHSRVRFSFEPAYDFVSDSADYEGPVKKGESADSVKISRYEGSHLIGDLQVNHDLLINVGQWRRNFANKRDTFSLMSRQIAFQYRLPWSWLGNTYALRLGGWSDRAEALYKSSYTHLDDFKITSLVVEQPSDQQQQMNFMVARDLGAARQLSAFIGLGRSRVDYQRITGTFVRPDGCEYRFQLEKTSGSVDQQGRCGHLLSNSTVMPNVVSITNNLGFNPEDDLSYRSLFFQWGVGYTWRSHYWQTRLGYYFQKFDRQGLDERIDQSGRDSVESNHSVSAEVTFHLNQSVSFFWQGEYVTSRLLTMVPFSYNPYTAERFSEAGLFFAVGLRLSL